MLKDALLHPHLEAELGSGTHTVAGFGVTQDTGVMGLRNLPRRVAAEARCHSLRGTVEMKPEWRWRRQGVRGARTVRHLSRRAAHRAWSPL